MTGAYSLRHDVDVRHCRPRWVLSVSALLGGLDCCRHKAYLQNLKRSNRNTCTFVVTDLAAIADAENQIIRNTTA